MGTIKAIDFAVKRDALAETKHVEKIYSYQLAPRQVLLEIDCFSLTSNNITYGVLGEQMHYWQFFPTDDGYGIIPAWGFATVVVSNHSEVPVGQRFYGYYPMGTHLLVTPQKVSLYGFVDGSEHRRALPSVYNFYADTTQDSSITPETEALVALFRPLFVTSFLIDWHLVEQNFYQAKTIVITSASSKTAQALAFLLAQRAEQHGLQLIGLTSEKNMDFVADLGWYHKAISYGALDKLSTAEKHIVVDFTGNHSTQYELQTTLGKNLRYNCLVGLVDWQHLSGDQPLPEKGEVFFAPTHAEKRQKELGIGAFQQEVGKAWQLFAKAVQSSISITQHTGSLELEKLYLDTLNGTINPKQGNMVQIKTP